MNKQTRTAVTASVGLLLFIFDSKTVLLGATEAIELCLKTVIPSLFPFFVLTGVLTNSLIGIKIPGLGKLGKLCGIPPGAESILLLGLLGGYPVGAKCINDCHRQGTLDKLSSGRMLGFCSNCGPSFLFGICASMFSNMFTPWVAWAVQILSALLTGILLPRYENVAAAVTPRQQISIQESLKSSMRIIAEVCGWVIAFRVVIELADRWFLWRFPNWLYALLIGMTELANGCSVLQRIAWEPIRFIICCFIMSFGGICVFMQTLSATSCCGIGMYLPGKAIQCLLCIPLGSLAVIPLYGQIHYFFAPLTVISVIGVVLILRNLQKRYSYLSVCVV